MPGITHLEEFQEPQLRALVDLTVEDAPETFADRFLPTEETFTRKFAFDIIKNNKYVAAYIGYGSEPPVMDRNAIDTKMGELAYFGLKDVVTYEELQALHEARNDDEYNATIDAITNKNIDLINGMLRLIYVAKMETLFKGRHEYITGEKNKIRFDFGIPASNKVALLPGEDFSSADFDVIGFFEDQVMAYKDANNGAVPEIAVTTREVRSLIQRNAGIVAEAGKPAGARATVGEVNDIFDSYGIPQLEVIEERHVTVRDLGTGQDKTIELVPQNRVTFLSQGVGTYLLGPTLENNFRPGLFVEAKDKDEPVRSILRGVGAGFPAPTAPSLIFHMDVFTP